MSGFEKAEYPTAQGSLLGDRHNSNSGYEKASCSLYLSPMVPRSVHPRWSAQALMSNLSSMEDENQSTCDEHAAKYLSLYKGYNESEETQLWDDPRTNASQTVNRRYMVGARGCWRRVPKAARTIWQRKHFKE